MNMNAVFKKLQFNHQDRIYVWGAPPELEPHLDQMRAITEVTEHPSCKKSYGFALFFVRSCADIAKQAERAARKVPGDGILWFAYPKKSSKRYVSDIGRDDGWAPLGAMGFEGVRQVSVDEDWSALRFRRVEHIKTMKRDPKRAISTSGKKRASGMTRA